MNKEKLIKQLYNSRKLITDEEYDMFESALEELAEEINIYDLPKLCKVFDDKTKDDEVMFGLVHLIETLLSDEYIDKIICITPLLREANEWAKILNKRLLNSKKYYSVYLEHICSLGEQDQINILTLLKDIKNDNPTQFGQKVDEIESRVGLK